MGCSRSSVFVEPCESSSNAENCRGVGPLLLLRGAKNSATWFKHCRIRVFAPRPSSRSTCAPLYYRAMDRGGEIECSSEEEESEQGPTTKHSRAGSYGIP